MLTGAGKTYSCNVTVLWTNYLPFGHAWSTIQFRRGRKHELSMGAAVRRFIAMNGHLTGDQ